MTPQLSYTRCLLFTSFVHSHISSHWTPLLVSFQERPCYVLTSSFKLLAGRTFSSFLQASSLIWEQPWAASVGGQKATEWATGFAKQHVIIFNICSQHTHTYIAHLSVLFYGVTQNTNQFILFTDILAYSILGVNYNGGVTIT